ncbi:MAG: hypothetical protein ACPGWR_19410 [Ardenticatenaceae bacterium]
MGKDLTHFMNLLYLAKKSTEIGAVRGQKVYELTTRRQLVIGPSNSLDVVIQQRFVNRSSAYRRRAHNAELQPVAGGGYELLIPASSTYPAMRVPVDFTAKPILTGGIHGSEQGPAQYSLIRDSSGWNAFVVINEALHRRDVPFIIGHELDEIAIIICSDPADDAAILAQGQASLFRPSSTSTNVTAHDRAAARELVELWQDCLHPPRGTGTAGITKREDRLLRMLDAMGLREPVHIFDKLRVLRAEGAPDMLLRKIGVPGERDRYLASAKFHTLTSSFPSLLTSGSMVHEELVSHLMIPLDPGRRTFLRDGINGGHHDGLLHEFINHHPKYVIVKEAQKVANGVLYRKYSQYRWKGSGPKPKAHDPRFPKPGDADAGTYDSDWALAKQAGVPLPKTTFSTLQDFLPAVDEAWSRWYNANTKLASSKARRPFTHHSTLTGIEVTGFFNYIRLTDQFRLKTVFVEASWF